eukprot:1155078-Pelagomonas_calceolata.AAC.5
MHPLETCPEDQCAMQLLQTCFQPRSSQPEYIHCATPQVPASFQAEQKEKKIYIPRQGKKFYIPRQGKANLEHADAVHLSELMMTAMQACILLSSVGLTLQAVPQLACHNFVEGSSSPATACMP